MIAIVIGIPALRFNGHYFAVATLRGSGEIVLYF